MKVCLISNMAAPYMVRMAEARVDGLDIRWLFHEHIDATRPSWWKIPLPDNCRILNRVLFKKSRRYLALDVLAELRAYDPDIVVLGATLLMPTNLVAYWWAKLHKKKTVVFSEYLRNGQGVTRDAWWFRHLIRLLYPGFDAIAAVGTQGIDYFRWLYPECYVVSGGYPQDLAAYFDQEIRDLRGRELNLIFAHKLLEYYNPLFAVRLLSKLNQSCSGRRFRLIMNSDGPLRESCIDLAASLGIADCLDWLNQIRRWEDLEDVYRRADISVSPATWSNGFNSVIECMAAGIPVIISDNVIGQRQPIRDENTGLVVPLDLEAFERAVIETVEDRDATRMRCLNARESVRSFTPFETLKRYAALFRKVHEGQV